MQSHNYSKGYSFFFFWRSAMLTAPISSLPLVLSLTTTEIHELLMRLRLLKLTESLIPSLWTCWCLLMWMGSFGKRISTTCGGAVLHGCSLKVHLLAPSLAHHILFLCYLAYFICVLISDSFNDSFSQSWVLFWWSWGWRRQWESCFHKSWEIEHDHILV